MKKDLIKDKKLFRLLTVVLICFVVFGFFYWIGYENGYNKEYERYYDKNIAVLEENK